MEAFLAQILPGLLDGRSSFTIHAHQGKPDLLAKLRGRLRGYAKWLPADARIIVLVDRDDDDCAALKRRLEADAEAAGLATRSTAGREVWRIVNRIAIEELEAWFFGEWMSVRRAFPRVPANIVGQASFRHCDAISGGTWEALERILKRRGYFLEGLRKIEAARAIGMNFDAGTCISPSFAAFRNAVEEAVAGP